MGCSPWGRYELDMTERLHFHFSNKQHKSKQNDKYKYLYVYIYTMYYMGFPSAAKGLACQWRRHRRCWFIPMGFEDPMEEGIATHSSILAWRISWTKQSCIHGLWYYRELDMTEGAKHAYIPVIHTSWSVKSNGPSEAPLWTKLVEMMKFQLSCFKS